MRRLLFFVCLLTSSIAVSQNMISFSEINQAGVDLSGSFKNYKLLEINDDLRTVTDGESFILNYVKLYSFTLKETRLMADDYVVNVKSEDGITSKNLFDLGFDGKYYTNTNATSDYQFALSVFENQYTVYIKSLGREFYIEPLRKFNDDASATSYVYYEVKDIIDSGGLDCPVKPDGISSRPNRNPELHPNDACKTVELNVCVDYSMYATYGNINETINRTFEILNLTQLDFSIANGLAYDVSFRVKRHYVITCNQCNYWPSTGDINTNHYAFLNYANYAPMFSEGSDIRVFWQADLAPNDYNGYGSQPVDINCFVDPVATIRVASLKNFVLAAGTNKSREVLSHEFGHNFSCEHSVSNTIMDGGAYLGHVWAASSISTINNSLTLSNCYYDCITQPCYNTRVQDLVLEVNDSDSVINFSWLSETGMEYKARLYNYTTNTWSAYATVNYPLNTVAFDYNTDPNTCSNKYKMEIVPVCSGTNGISQVLVFTVPAAPSPNLAFESTVQEDNLCMGSSYTFVVHAEIPGSNPVYQWKVNSAVVGANAPSFTTSDLQNNDVLSCQITNSELCLLSQTATVSKMVTILPQPCNLSNSEFETMGFAYFPNPVKDQLNIKSLSDIESISIYNLLGQKIFVRSIHSMESVLDLSFLPVSAYLVKVEFDGHSEIIKIIRD